MSWLLGEFAERQQSGKDGFVMLIDCAISIDAPP